MGESNYSSNWFGNDGKYFMKKMIVLKFIIISLIALLCSPTFAEEKTEPAISSQVSMQAVQIEDNYEVAKESLQSSLAEAHEKIELVTEPIQHSITTKESLRWIVFWLLVGLVTIWVGVRTMRLHGDPDVSTILQNPEHFLNVPINRLEKVIKLLTKIGILNRILTECKITEQMLKKAISFNRRLPDNIFYFKILQERLGEKTSDNKSSQNGLPFYELILHPDCPLPFHLVYLYFPSQNTEVFNIGNKPSQIIFIITTDSVLQEKFSEYRLDRTTNVIVPNLVELTQLLLSQKPLEVLTKICANQLHIAHISPYQTEAGVYRDMNFFGRGAILRRIMTPPIKNYLICGGRQLGKSSLLKAIERHYKKDKMVKCYYIILAGDIHSAERDLVLQLVNALGLEESLSFDDVVRFLRQPREITYIFLIDEIDSFICHDRLKNYPVIRHFLSLSQTANCFFMFGGFWELYTSTFLENLSPLKNFAEFVPIAGLEENASYELATVPMEWLGLEYEDKELPYKINELIGRRANLITSVCHEILQILPSHITKISEDDIRRAANSTNIYAKIAMSWGRLVDNIADAQLDRMIIYMCAKSIERLNNNDIRKALAQYEEYHYIFPQFEQALKRLELAYILKRDLDDNRYDFCVPLFVKQLRETPLDELLELEMFEYRYRKKT